MFLVTEPVEPNFLANWWGVLRRRWRVGVLVFGVVFGLAALLVLTARPVYRAEAKLRIGEPPPSPGVSSGGASIFGFMRIGGDPFANDLELLRSRTVAEAIVRDAALTAKVIAPKGWHRDSLFSVLTTSDTTIKATFQARWTRPDQIEVRQLAPHRSLVGRFAAGAPVHLAGLDVVFRARRPKGPDKIRISVLPFGEAARRTASRVDVTRVRREANVVRLVSTDSDPAIARGVLRSAVARFIELRTSIQKRESSQNVDSLRAVARNTLAELTRAESELESLQRHTRLIDPEAQGEAFVTRHGELSVAVERTRAHVRAIESVLAQADTLTAPGARWNQLLAFPAFRENPLIVRLLDHANGLEQQRRQLAARRSEKNLEYSLLIDQIGFVDRSLAALAADLQKTLSAELAREEAELAKMDAVLAAVPRQSIELARRERSAEMLGEILMLTEQRLRQEELRQALSFANVQVIDAPALRYRPVWPRNKLGLAVGWLIAGFCALLALVVSERTDRRLRRATDVTRLTGAPVLGVALRADSGLRLSTQELNAVVQHASVNGRGPLRIVVAPVGKTPGYEVTAALREVLPPPTRQSAADSERAEVVQVASLVDFATASAAAAQNVPIALVVEVGRTTIDDLARAVAWVNQAGGRIGGTIILCNSARRAAEVWA